MQDWMPESYDRFDRLRLRPALDLLAQVGAVPGGEVIDLGCGSGAMGSELAARFGGRRIVGIDSSPAMLGEARATGAFDRLEEADIAGWRSQEAPALIYSNAALQWLDNHELLFPRLAGMLCAGGWLAAQMPDQAAAPSHRGWAECFAALFGDREVGKSSEVLAPEAYVDLLAPFGAVEVWESVYYQHLPRAEDGHPVRLFTESTFARPYLAAAGSAAARARLIEAYEAAMAEAYPLRVDGSVLFPFRRLFVVLCKAQSRD